MTEMMSEKIDTVEAPESKRKSNVRDFIQDSGSWQVDYMMVINNEINRKLRDTLNI